MEILVCILNRIQKTSSTKFILSGIFTLLYLYSQLAIAGNGSLNVASSDGSVDEGKYVRIFVAESAAEFAQQGASYDNWNPVANGTLNQFGNVYWVGAVNSGNYYKIEFGDSPGDESLGDTITLFYSASGWNNTEVLSGVNYCYLPTFWCNSIFGSNWSSGP